MERASRRFTWLYAKSEVKLKYRYTLLGVLWNLLDPLLYLGVLSLVFSVVNRMQLRDYAVFLFSALVPWRYFEKIVATCMDSIVQGDWLLKKLPVSPFALPLTRWMVASVEFGFSFLAVSLVLAALKTRFTIHCVVLPLSAAVWSIFGLGLGLVCAVLFTFFRDIRPIVNMCLMFAFFSAPILFRADLYPEQSFQARMVSWHPLTYFAALFQKPLYYAAWPSGLDWGVACAAAAASLAVGSLTLNAFKTRLYFYV